MASPFLFRRVFGTTLAPNLLHIRPLTTTSLLVSRGALRSPFLTSTAGTIRAYAKANDENPWEGPSRGWYDWEGMRNPDFRDKRYPPGKDPDPQLFGYPEIPTEYPQLRDPRKGWWDMENRRNFGEIVQLDDEAYSTTTWEYDPNYPVRWAFYSFGLLFFSFWLALQYEYYTYEYPHAVDREYPHNGAEKAFGRGDGYREFIFTGVDPRDAFEGTQREYYLGPDKDIGSLKDSKSA